MTTTNNNIIILNGITFTYNIIDISKIDKWNNTRFKANEYFRLRINVQSI